MKPFSLITLSVHYLGLFSTSFISGGIDLITWNFVGGPNLNAIFKTAPRHSTASAAKLSNYSFVCRVHVDKIRSCLHRGPASQQQMFLMYVCFVSFLCILAFRICNGIRLEVGLPNPIESPVEINIYAHLHAIPIIIIGYS